MKTNVDLTENNMFDNRKSSLKRIFHNISEDISGEDFQSLFIEGNKSRRGEIRELRKAINTEYCDCCGKKLNTKPWEFEIGVCNECKNNYLNKNDRNDWRIK